MVLNIGKLRIGQISTITPVFDIIWSSLLWILHDALLSALNICVREYIGIWHGIRLVRLINYVSLGKTFFQTIATQYSLMHYASIISHWGDVCLCSCSMHTYIRFVIPPSNSFVHRKSTSYIHYEWTVYERMFARLFAYLPYEIHQQQSEKSMV